MIFREADIADYPGMHEVRISVRENRLPDPGLIGRADYAAHLLAGKGWLCEIEGRVAGFAILDKVKANIWALFVKPEYEGRKIGSRLHDNMLAYYFDHSESPLHLGTTPNTRAAAFYSKRGWKQEGIYANGDLKFTLSKENWKARQP